MAHSREKYLKTKSKLARVRPSPSVKKIVESK